MNASVTSFRLPLATPLKTSSGVIDERAGWILQLEGSVTGLGEATPLPGFTEPHHECEPALRNAVAALNDENWPKALSAVADAPAARHALVTAILDWRARKNDHPLYRELGGHRQVETLSVHATIGDADRAETVKAAREAVASGFETIKVKVGGRDLERDLRRIEAVRDAIGPTINIRVDGNGAWDRKTARRAIDGLGEDDVALLEQPLDPTDLAGHRELRGDIPIGLDESLVSSGTEAVFDADAADVLVLKPMALGGIDVARGVAIRARKRGTEVLVSNTIDGAIARTAAVHLAASLPQPTVAGLATASLLEADVAADPSPVENGEMAVPQDPGLGIETVSADA